MRDDQVAYLFAVTITFLVYSSVQLLEKREDPVVSIAYVFRVCVQDLFLEINWSLLWVSEINSFRKIQFLAIFGIFLLHFSEISPVFSPFKLVNGIVAQGKVQDFCCPVVDNDFILPELLGNLASSHHTGQKWTTFDNDFLEFVLLSIEMFGQHRPRGLRLHQPLCRERWVVYIRAI